jgi:putative DNA primase/helicase
MSVSKTPASALPRAFLERLGAVEGDQSPPATKLDHALHLAGQGFHVFPCTEWVGNRLVEDWYKEATTNADKIAAWWSKWPMADIAAVPAKSGHFVIVVRQLRHPEMVDGWEAWSALQEEFGDLPYGFEFDRPEVDFQMWFEGEARTSRDHLGKGINVYGIGSYVFLPPSLTHNL